MAEAFDPYYIWLGIPPEEQPADHYRLLGVRRFETNDEVISNAADQRVRHLRGMQTGKRQAESQKLLNEIAAVAGMLLDPDKRKEYDAKLRAKEAAQVTRPAPIQPAPLRTATPILVAATLPAPLSPKPIVQAYGQALAAPSPITAPSHRKSSLTIWIAMGGAACVAIAAGLIGTVALTMMARRTDTDAPQIAEKPAKNPGVPAYTGRPQTGEKPPSISSPPNLKQAVGTASSDPPVVGKSSGPAGSGNLVPTKVAATARDAQKESGKAMARFVRIELPGKAKVLNLAEVQVYSGSENVAVKGNATQSSTGYDGAAKLANDGNTNGQYSDSKSVCHTNLEDNPWWEVDLGAEKTLDKIVVWNRTDGGTEVRLQGYKVLAMDASRNVIWQVSPPEYPKPSSEFAPSGISGGTDLAASTSGGSTSQDAFDLTTKEGKTLRVKAIKKHDVLAATTRTDVKGTMKVMEGGKGLLTSGKVLDRAEFPMMLPSQYMIETTLTRVAGDDWIVFGLHVDDHPTALVLDGYQKDGYFSGLELVKGLSVTSPNNPTAIKGRQLTNNKWASLRVIVTSSRVLADLDGRRIFEWSGDPATLQRDPFSATPNFKNLSLGTWMSSYHIESLKVTSIEVADSSPIAKLAVPEGVALASAREKVNKTFAESLAKSKKPEEKLALAKELLTVAETEKDRAVRFALLDLARNLAVAGQDVSTAVSVAESMTGQYEIDESQLKLETLKQTSGMTMPADTWEAAAELAAELATAAQDSGRLELADRASQLAMEHAGHSRDVDFKKSIKQMRDRVTAQLKLWEVVKAAERTLQTSPDDPAANLAVGKWYCLHLGDWDKGIPHLAKSGDANLTAAAVAENDARLLPAADAWTAAAETLTGAEQLAAQKHALELYQEASEKLKGLEQLKAAKRVAEVTELLAQSDRPIPSAGEIAPPTKVATDALRPGLLVRIYASQPPAVPTPALGIIHSYGDFALRRDQLAQDLQFAPQRLAFSGIGYIDLDKDETITFRIRNGVCYVDGDRVLSNTPDLPTKSGPKKKKNKNPDQVKKLLKRGRHSLKIRPFDAAADGPDFRITREGGSSAISYSPADLDAELAKPVSFHGTSVKGRFSLGNR